MAFDMFTSRKTVTQQYQQQVALQGGGEGSQNIAVGAQGEFRSGGAGSILGNISAGGRGSSIHIVDSSATIRALEANQAVSEQSISAATINSNRALEVLQALGGQFATLAAGGTAREVAAAQAPEAVAQTLTSPVLERDTKIIGAFVALAVLGATIYVIQRKK